MYQHLTEKLKGKTSFATFNYIIRHLGILMVSNQGNNIFCTCPNLSGIKHRKSVKTLNK